jgi:hypothetical protein
MQGNRFCIPVHLHGTLAANSIGTFKLPFAATLLEVSATAANDSAATLQLGHNADADGILVAIAIGDSAAPTVFDAGDFTGSALPTAPTATPLQQVPLLMSFAKGDLLTWILDFDGAGGTAAQNVSILFTFMEG